MAKFTIYIMRHENRHEDGLFDCSLTSDGMYKAIVNIPEKLNNDKYISESSTIAVYCSPNLRTIQTIYPFCSEAVKNGKSIKLKYEDSLYERLNYNIQHYFNLNHKPRIGNFNFYCKEIENLNAVLKLINVNLMDAKNMCRLVIQSIYDPVSSFENGKWNHAFPIIKTVIKKLNRAVVNIDIAQHFEIKNKKYIDLCNTILDDIIKIQTLLTDNFGNDQFVDREYTSLIDLDTFWDDSVIPMNDENPNALLVRTTKIVHTMMTDDNYKNSIYVAHSTIISSIVCNILKWVYKDNMDENFNKFINDCTSESDFVDRFKTNPGDIHKIDIDTDNKTVHINLMI